VTTTNTALTFHTTTADDTRVLAERLGRLLQPNDVLCLIGDLGVGKTTFTQGLALGLGLPPDEPVNSPTFTLIAEHHGGRLSLYHFDVYRLLDSSGLYDLAFDEYLDAGGVVVIEWANKIADALPDDRVDITLTAAGENERMLIMTAQGERAYSVLQRLNVSVKA
jgi:tRNA threonylcarbamoyladenosine biosynthesis protein TsaE